MEETAISEEKKREAEEKRKQRLAREIEEDFACRREERRSLENGWRLNMNFLSGNQYCDISPYGDLEEEDKRFYWQSRRVFNHIAPTIDSRISKLTRMRPALHVRAASDEEGDLRAAKLASAVLAAVRERTELDCVVARATLWSETCGSAFYKITWDENGGRQVGTDGDGRPVYEGEADVEAVPPFAIFPDNLAAEDMEGVQSLICARIVPVSVIAGKFGVALRGREVSDLAPVGYSEPSARKNPARTAGDSRTAMPDSEILVERYTRPGADAPEGKLEIEAGGVLLYEGPLPYINGEKGKRDFPFVRQDCLRLPGAFFGCSVIDRLIPVQRAYNAIRNRKHEFLNRLSMGVVTVEDGSVDTDELAEEGLAPGRILVYRQGGKPPEMLDCGEIPENFAEEESRLEEEFSLISGVSDLSQNSTPARVTSAAGLQLLLSQDDARLSATTDNLALAQKQIGRQIIRLYKQFAGSARLLAAAGEGKRTEVFYFNASELSAEDIVFQTEEASTPEQKRETLLRLFEAGLLSDGEGKVSEENKLRILDAFGFGSYENAKDISALHVAKAAGENGRLVNEDVSPDGYDDHALHVAEHLRFLLSEELKGISEGLKKRAARHIRAHERLMKQGDRVEMNEETTKKRKEEL